MNFGGIYLFFVFLSFFQLLYLYKRFKDQHASFFAPSFLFFIFSIFYFCVSPLLLDYFDYKMMFSSIRLNHDDYLLTWSVLNFVGLSLVMLVSKLKIGFRPKGVWKFSGRMFVLWWLAFSFASFFLQVWVYSHFGGVSGYVNTYLSGSQASVFKGYGIVFMLSEAFPLIFIIGLGYFMSAGNLSKKFMLPVLIVYAILLIFFGGLRGSRSMFVFRMFAGVGVLHYFGLKINRGMLFFGLIFLVAFMFFYKVIYKSKAFAHPSGLESVTHVDEGKILQFILITDFSRVDIQTLLIHQLEKKDFTNVLGFGRTYLVAFNVLIPTVVYKLILGRSKPPNKTLESSNIILGEGSFSSGRRTSYVHGLLGEGLLNFGIIGSFLPFLFFGAYIKYVNSYFNNISPNDSRVILLPLFALSILVLLQGDFDNFIFFLMNYSFLPLCLIFLSSRKLKCARHATTRLLPRRG